MGPLNLHLVLLFVLLMTTCRSKVSVQTNSGATSAKLTNGLKAFNIYPKNATLKAGSTVSFTAVATYNSGSVVDVTNKVTWFGDQSMLSFPHALTESNGKLVSSENIDGIAKLTAKMDDNVSASTDVTVVALKSISVTSTAARIGINASNQFTAIASYSNG